MDKRKWLPIEDYDALKVKPKMCIFYVEETQLGRNTLKELISESRHFGTRNVTHYMVAGSPHDKGE